MSNTVNRPSVSLDLAQRIVAACEEKSRELDKLMVIAVVDESGVLKAFSRMDGAALLSVSVAEGKAFSAAAQGIPTDAWHDFIKDDPPLLVGAGLADERLVMIGGGYPIVVDGAVVGGVGVSGGYYTEDMEVAQHGLTVLD